MEFRNKQKSSTIIFYHKNVTCWCQACFLNIIHCVVLRYSLIFTKHIRQQFFLLRAQKSRITLCGLIIFMNIYVNHNPVIYQALILCQEVNCCTSLCVISKFIWVCSVLKNRYGNISEVWPTFNRQPWRFPF